MINYPDVYFSKDVPGGRTLDVIPLLFGRARICIGPTGSVSYDDVW